MIHVLSKPLSHMDQAFIKLYKEEEIRVSGKEYEENGKKWFHKPDFNTRAGAVILGRLGLAKYIVPTIDGYPDWENIRWVSTEFKSFREFHETWSEILYNRIEEDREKNQQNQDLEGAYEVLEKLGKTRRFHKKIHQPKEMPWYAKN